MMIIFLPIECSMFDLLFPACGALPFWESDNRNDSLELQYNDVSTPYPGVRRLSPA